MSDWPTPNKRRASGLGPTEMHLLRTWGAELFRSFRIVPDSRAMPYLVGSCARNEPWRDVDVRIICADTDPLVVMPPQRRRAIDTALSVWGQRATGLPIDCQVQSMAEANVPEHDGPRNPIGLSEQFPDHGAAVRAGMPTRRKG